jgi:hypothetical protein
MEAVIWFVLGLAGFTTTVSTIGMLIMLGYLIGQIGLMLYRKLMTGKEIGLQESPSL